VQELSPAREPCSGGFLLTCLAMYAVVNVGGKQAKVSPRSKVRLERVQQEVGAELELEPVLVLDDGGTLRATPSDLQGCAVRAKVLRHFRGPKINGLTYKPKTRQYRRYGHRQDYTEVEILAITAPGQR